MSEQKEHTPGPWEAKAFIDPQWVVATKGNPSHYVCVTSQGNDEANARLIAAAPDLLAACEFLLASLATPRDGTPFSPVMRQMKQAIAKAKVGE